MKRYNNGDKVRTTELWSNGFGMNIPKDSIVEILGNGADGYYICSYNGEQAVYPQEMLGDVAVITNADRIRTMSDEELADWMHNLDHHFGDDNEPMVGVCDVDTNELTEIYDSFGDLLEWLQKERSVSKGDE